jgi:2-oxoglutarate dehydrogenase E2 component (dihydrolipoamide succinyltransferase)
MTIEIQVPPLPESVADATIAAVHIADGDAISRDQNLFDLETDKVMIEVPSAESGAVVTVHVKEGDVVTSGQLLATIEPGAAAKSAPAAKAATATKSDAADTTASDDDAAMSPVVRRLLSENDLDAASIKGTGKNGRIVKTDVEAAIAAAKVPATNTSSAQSAPALQAGRVEERVPMTRLRARIAERLLQVKQQTAMLTTFNEIDMKPVMDMRGKYKKLFEKEHDVRLGFMSFFVKAAVAALQKYPEVNASIDGNDIVYHNYQDIGIAVGSKRGLVVPILRDAQCLSMAGIEKDIRAYAEKAQTGKLTIEEMTGGTFTITNGGTFGSMLSTPIINPPQSAILGMHNIVERAVVVDGEIVARPIMYVALSYDHCIIDGSTAVGFLKTIKEYIEDPARMMLSV